MNVRFSENAIMKFVRSEEYNYNFNKVNGYFERWGNTQNDDPEFAPGPEILDFEVTTICNGVTDKNGKKNVCAFCYKSNTSKGLNTSFEDFKMVLDKMPKTLTQIAFGADASATSNPDLFKMMEYAKSKGIIPNITVAEIDGTTAFKLAEICGAVAVSRYENKKNCYDSIYKLHTFGLDQINIHILVSKETEQWIWETFRDYLNGDIVGLNAIVLLGLKQKGRGEHFNVLSKEKYKKIINYALDNDIPIGMDSCSANKFAHSIKDNKDVESLLELIEPCESTCFSMYIDEKCHFYPCSFSPKTEGWDVGIDMLKIENFSEVWNHPKTITFKEILLNNKDENGLRKCPLYDI